MKYEKIDFADLGKDAKSVADFSPFRQFSVRLNHGEIAPLETNFFGIAGTSEVYTSVSAKAKGLLAFGPRKKVSCRSYLYIKI